MAATLKNTTAAFTVAALIVLYAAGWPWNTDMARQPAPGPAAGPRPPADGTLPLGGEWPLERWQMEQIAHAVPAQPAISQQDGGRLFGIYCTPCHGQQGGGDGRVASVFVQPGSLRGTEVQEHNDGWIYGTIRNGANAMPRYGPELPAAQRWEIVRFVRTLKEP